MKKRFSLAFVALFAMVSFVSLHAAETTDPEEYQNEVVKGDFTSFNPTGNFSLQAKMENGQTIEVRNASGEGFEYRTTKPGVFSFLVDLSAGTVKVYRYSALNDEIPVTTSTTPITIGEDLINAEHDQSKRQGIYSLKNLIKNPGFESGDYWEGYDPEVDPSKTDIRKNPSDWFVNTANQIATRCRANNFITNTGFEGLQPVSEGNFAFMLHNDATPLWQELSNLKPSTQYKVAFRQLAHKDTSPVTSYTSMIMADSVSYATADSSNVIESYTYNSAASGFGNYIDVTYTFTTPASLPAKMFLVIRKTDLSSSCIQNYDMMTMQEVASGDIHYNGIISAVERMTWQDGLQVPVGGSDDIYDDVTADYFVNPSFETTDVTLAPNSEDPTTGNSGVWMPYGWRVAYSATRQAPSLWDQGLITEGPSGIDQSQNPPKSSDTGYRAADGTYFYYYRTRWMDNQDFSLSQCLKDLKKGSYDLSVFAAADVNNPATLKVRGLLMNTMEIADPTMKSYTIPFDVVSDGDSAVVSISVSRVHDSQARLAVDHFQLIYRGLPDEEGTKEALRNTLDVQVGEAAPYEEDAPSGIKNDLRKARELAEKAWETDDVEDLSAAVYAYNDALDKAMAAADAWLELLNIFDEAVGYGESSLPGASELSARLYDEFIYVFGDTDAAGNPTNYYLADVNNFIAEIASAIRDCRLSIIQDATETTPVEITDVAISAPNFTREGGDITLAADRERGAWVTANNPASYDQYKLHTAGERNCWNNWHNNFSVMDIYQDLTDMPEGIYELKALTTTNGVPHDQHAYIRSVSGTANSPYATYQYSGSAFDTETEWESLTTTKLYVPAGSTLRIGFASTSGGGTSGWFCVTGFQLFYYQPTIDEAKRILDEKIETVRTLLDTADVKIMGAEKALLNSAISAAESAATFEEITVASVALDAGVDTANVSIKNYNDLLPTLVDAKVLVEQAGYSAAAKEALNGTISEQEELLAASTTSASDIPGMKTVLVKAMNVFKNSAMNIPDNVSPENPYDLTSFLVNPALDETTTNGEVPNGWMVNRVDGDKNSTAGQHYSGDASNRYLDSYNATAGKLVFTVKQILYGVPNGTYRLTAAVRSGGEGAYLFATGHKPFVQEIENNGSENGSIWEAAEDGSEIKLANEGKGWGWQYLTVDQINVDNNQLTVGITNDPLVSGVDKAWTGNWYSADDFKLYYISKDFVTGLEDVNVDENPLNVYVENGYIRVEGVEDFQVMTLSGTPVPANTQLAPGFYIVTVGSKSVKVVVK